MLSRKEEDEVIPLLLTNKDIHLEEHYIEIM